MTTTTFPTGQDPEPTTCKHCNEGIKWLRISPYSTLGDWVLSLAVGMTQSRCPKSPKPRMYADHEPVEIKYAEKDG
jgi:hypothetical protein